MLVTAAILLAGCRRPATESRAPGQPTMNELMHRSAAARKENHAQWQERSKKVRALTASQAANLEAELRKKPAGVSTREVLFLYYVERKEWQKITPHLLWAIDNAKPGMLSPLSGYVPDPAVSPDLYEAGKRRWLARLNGGGFPDFLMGVRYLMAGDKRLTEQLILDHKAKGADPKQINGLLGGLYSQVLVGSQGPLPMGVVRHVSVSEAHGSHAQEIRRKLDSTDDQDLLLYTGRVLADSGMQLQRSGTLDFDPYLLGRQYIERGIKLKPDTRQAQLAKAFLDRAATMHGFSEVWRRGGNLDEHIAKAPDEQRLHLLPLAMESAFHRNDKPNAEKRSREYLALVKRYPEHPRYGQSWFEANQFLGKLALRRGDRRLASRYLMASTDAPASAEMKLLPMDMTLARSLVDWGDRTTVAKFLDRCAGISARDGEKYRNWASDVRKGINPDLAPYRSGCSQDPC